MHVSRDLREADALRAAWEEWQATSPNTNVCSSLSSRRDAAPTCVACSITSTLCSSSMPHETLTVMMPEITAATTLGRVLRSPNVLHLKARLFFRPEIVVTTPTLPALERALPLGPREMRHRCIVPIAELDRPSLQSLAYARSISPYVTAAHIAMNEQEVEAVQSKWERLHTHLAPEEETYLVVIELPYRSLLRPLLAYIDTVRRLYPEDTLPLSYPSSWWPIGGRFRCITRRHSS